MQLVLSDIQEDNLFKSLLLKGRRDVCDFPFVEPEFPNLCYLPEDFVYFLRIAFLPVFEAAATSNSLILLQKFSNSYRVLLIFYADCIIVQDVLKILDEVFV